MPESLEEVLSDTWARLEAGARQPGTPFHTPALATLDGDECAVRTVVLRRVDVPERRLVCHTDRRSPKTDQMARRPRVTWLFYDAREKIQVRASGIASLHRDDALAETQWEASRPMSRRCYLGASPSIASRERTSGLPDALRERTPTPSHSESGRQNFLVVACVVQSLDWLHLHAGGHARAAFVWDGQQWDSTWLTP